MVRLSDERNIRAGAECLLWTTAKGARAISTKAPVVS